MLRAAQLKYCYGYEGRQLDLVLIQRLLGVLAVRKAQIYVLCGLMARRSVLLALHEHLGP